MDSKGFFLGLIAAVVLFLLWKKEGAQLNFAIGPQAGAGSNPVGPQNGCGASCGSSPSYAAGPSAQSMVYGNPGQITPGAPPLQSVAGVGSFYAASGPTPDNTFTNIPLTSGMVDRVSSNVRVASEAGWNVNVPGSPSTPANAVPLRAVQPVPTTSQAGFQQRYNVVGIPRTAGARYLIN